MAQRQGQRNKGQGKAQNPTGARAQASQNTAGRARGVGAVDVSTAETPREERARAMGRRARARVAQEQAARRRRLSIIIGAITAVVVVAIVVAAFLLNGSNKAVAALAANDSKLNPAKPPAVGKPAPNFALATVGGKHYSLSALRGHPVLLEYFAVWCPHCQREAPILNQLDKSYAAQGLRSLSILASPYDRTHEATGSTNPVTKDDINWFQTTYNVAHPMLIDPDFTTVNKYGVQGYPTIYVLDKNGVIRYTGSADIPYPTLAKAVDAAIKGQSVK